MTADSSAEIKKKIQIDKILRIRYSFTFIPLVLGLGLMAYVDIPFRSVETLKITVAEYIYPIFIAASFISALLWYLQTGFKDRKIFEQDPDFAKSHTESGLKQDKKIADLENQVKLLHKLHSDKIETASAAIIDSAIRDAHPKLLESLQETAEKDNYRDRLNLIINQSRDQSFHRIRNEINRLGFRGAVYLTTGVCLAILGILGLAGFVFPGAFGAYSKLFDSAPAVGASDYAIAIHYTSRFSLIISIEILAYFFLRLHKSNLIESKYYQNELTNLELKYISLDAALHLDRADTSHKVISEFSETERNHILEKGQSTIELKKIELEKNQFIEITKSLVSLAPKSK
ncbi:hypothetical protein [Pseudomonas sp. BF-B-28]|uniref:hypothetical protein n=1 Tax=Pseudomonas sp. BF-B-28 TaxID=2832353 RepID=UPI001CBF6BCE|nr:hypothetical protein [Pseudomonas sp. BF-B-28]